MVKNYTNLLKDMPLFKNIAPDDIETMLVCLDPYAKFYKKGNYITHCGDSIDSVGVILQGAVQMLKEDVWETLIYWPLYLKKISLEKLLLSVGREAVRFHFGPLLTVTSFFFPLINCCIPVPRPAISTTS